MSEACSSALGGSPKCQDTLFASMVFFLFPKPTPAVFKVKSGALSKYGAKVVQALDETVTHVLVQKEGPTLSPELFSGSWAVVNNNWVSDSIDRKRVLDTVPYEVWPPRNVVIRSRQPSFVGTTSPSKRPRSASNSLNESSRESTASSEKPTSESGVPRPTGNQFVLEVFKELANERKSGGKTFSNQAYERAIRKIATCGRELRSFNDARAIGLSPKLSQLVDDILHGKIPDAVLNASSEKSSVLALFETLYGVGPKTAWEFYNLGYRSLDDVKKHVTDANILVSLEHNADFVERISRTEVDKHFAVVQATLRELDPGATAICMGSYRRGEPDCGDIDVIITKPRASVAATKKLVAQVVDKLAESGFARHTFGGGAGSRRWLGATAFDHGKWRRMDILGVPDAELGASLIYYTGNELFNRRLRLKAGRMGMRLNERGLFDRDTDKLIESHDEKRIFEILETPWREPTDRVVI